MRGAELLAGALRSHWNDALLFRTLATLRTDAPVFDRVTELEWQGPTAAFEAVCHRLGTPDAWEAAMRLARR